MQAGPSFPSPLQIPLDTPFLTKLGGVSLVLLKTPPSSQLRRQTHLGLLTVTPSCKMEMSYPALDLRGGLKGPFGKAGNLLLQEDLMP